jgi:anhydro-N-acetylmuramic acid kinase
MKIYKIIGLMSGTSLDGLDLAYCHLWHTKGAWKYKIVESDSVPYTPEMHNNLKDAIYLPADELLRFHATYGTWLGQQAKSFIVDNRLEVDYIASHGHTTHHQPDKGFTFQIGSGQHLANVSGKKVICDFRTNDVALGGQGAPLVPIGDKLLFGNYNFCLNLGGISNVSFENSGKRIAYDIGLANMILNYISRKNGLEYDKGGKIAKTGKINTGLLQELNALKYYTLPFPKSIGYEWFVQEVVPLVEATADTLENLLCTAIHHICEQIATQIKSHAMISPSTVLITGGGALNDFLINILQGKLGPNFQVVIPEKQLIDFKEALIFALMAVLRVESQTNVLCSVTGAKRDSSSGVIYLPS